MRGYQQALPHDDFNPRTPCGVRPSTAKLSGFRRTFQSTHPLRGATIDREALGLSQDISIHAPLAGCDEKPHHVTAESADFNPRTPCGVRPGNYTLAVMGIDFNPRTPCGVRLGASLTFNGSAQISIHAPLAGCDPPSAFEVVEVRISIHAPLAGCDDADDGYFSDTVEISIHAPLAGCDGHLRPVRASVDHFNPRTPCGVRPRRTSTPCGVSRFQSTHPLRGATLDDSHYNSTSAFQSTHPLRGATRRRIGGVGRQMHFNPRTPCGVRRGAYVDYDAVWFISIHAPLAGCDGREASARRSTAEFQSTHPLRGATRLSARYSRLMAISIHAPLAGCDAGEMTFEDVRTFQSTHPLRGATWKTSNISSKL